MAKRSYHLLGKIFPPEDSMNVRILHALQDAGIYTLASLTSQTESSLRRIRKLGPHSIAHIKGCLNENRLSLADE